MKNVLWHLRVVLLHHGQEVLRIQVPAAEVEVAPVLVLDQEVDPVLLEEAIELRTSLPIDDFGTDL